MQGSNMVNFKNRIELVMLNINKIRKKKFKK